MGIDTQRHIGPYLKIQVPMREVIRITHGRCCGRSLEPGFCPKCGKPVEGTKTPDTEEMVHPAEVGELIKERLYALQDCCGQVDDGNHYWMINRTDDAIDPDKAGAQEIEPRDISLSVQNFKDEYADDIATIEAAYGCKGTVHFGLLVWSS
jgi:hypothetical protein